MNYKILKSYMAEGVLLLYILIVCIFKLYDVSQFIDFINIVFFVLLGIIYYFLFGFSNSRNKTKSLTIKTIIMWILIYYFLTYMLGIILGFLLSPYSFTFGGILNNIIPSILLIVVQEIVRFMYIRVKGNSYVRIGIFTLLFIIFDIVIGFRIYNLSSIDGIIKFVGLLLLPSVSKHLLLSYLSCKSGYVSGILYRLLLETIIFVLPIVPDLSVYIESVVKISFPVLLFFTLDSTLEKYENNKRKKRENKRVYVYVPITFILIILVSLVSGIFKYHMIAIGSGSMEPYIKIGDAVIIEKLSKEELSLLDNGDLLAFENDNRIVVHRIEEIKIIEDSYEFITKGDANANVDDFVVKEDDVIGTVNVKIPYIGLPSVWLSDIFN